jgi:hypothetical protein
MKQKQIRLTDVVGLVETPLRLRLASNRKHFTGTLQEDGTITINDVSTRFTAPSMAEDACKNLARGEEIGAPQRISSGWRSWWYIDPKKQRAMVARTPAESILGRSRLAVRQTPTSESAAEWRGFVAGSSEVGALLQDLINAVVLPTLAPSSLSRSGDRRASLS